MSCFFCQRNIREIDFKEPQFLENFISGSGKIRPKKRTGVCSGHQRKLAIAIKRARFLGLLSATSK
ncbi:MAG: 30S ribosomal protein S18 [Candidatus Nealsonbacteria bacterium]|nr:30S ribosomal protein S18 [Candidatus Nealsonbacteria bacterium]